MTQISCRKQRELGWYSPDNRVEWLRILSGGALRFAPFPTCKFAELELSIQGLRVGIKAVADPRFGEDVTRS